jgi:hypothetical protein
VEVIEPYHGRLLDPFSGSRGMFVHVANNQAGNVRQYDGWDTALRGLEMGDVIAQHVRIPLEPDTPAETYQLQVGLYDSNSGQRWQAQTPTGSKSVVRFYRRSRSALCFDEFQGGRITPPAGIGARQ